MFIKKMANDTKDDSTSLSSEKRTPDGAPNLQTANIPELPPKAPENTRPKDGPNLPSMSEGFSFDPSQPFGYDGKPLVNYFSLMHRGL